MRDMYNSSQKQAYIEATAVFESNRSVKNYENLFLSISEYENALHQDIAEMTVEHAKSVIIQLGMFSASSLLTTLTILRAYSQWCIDFNLVDNENPLATISVNDFDVSASIRNKLLSSPSQLEEIFSKAFPPDSEVEFKEQSQLLVWLMYLGFNDKCICQIKKSGVLYNEKCIVAENGKCIEVNDEILSLAKFCMEQDTISRIDSNGVGRTYSLNDNEYLFRAIANGRTNPSLPAGLMLIVSRIRSVSTNYTEHSREIIELTPDRIFRSGLFYRVYQIEQTGNEITNEIICDVFGLNYNSVKTMSNEISKKKKDYNNWKKAFGM